LRTFERVLPRIARGRVERARGRIGGLAGRLHALSPLATLGRGYALAIDDDGRVLSRVGDFRIGGTFELRVRDGSVRATADSTQVRSDSEGEDDEGVGPE
jgi:exodeoxyribonuclease VII large subunit